MATISDITQGASYRGDPNLGGELAVGVTLDPSPLARLATFTYYRDRDMWEKKNQDDKLAADKIAAMSAYDTSSPLKPFSEDLKKSLQEIQKFVRENPDSLVYSRNQEKYQQREDMINTFLNKRKGATANDVLYNAKKSKIGLIQNKADRDAQMQLLDLDANDLFKDGVDAAYEQQIQLSPELNPEDYKIPEIPLTEAFTITRNENDTVIEGKAYADMDRVDALADGAYFGLGQAGIDVNSQEFKNLSEEQQRRVLLENKITTRKRATLENIAASIDGLIQSTKAKFSDPNNPISITDLPDSELMQQGSIGNYIRSVKGYNRQIDEINAATGKSYPHINLDDGATPQEIIKLEFFNKNGGTLYKELKPTVQQTDNAIQLEKIRADKALVLEALDWDKEKFKQQTQGTEQVKNGATIFAERIYNELKSLADKNGVISPEKLRRLTVEQLKYLGYDKGEVDAESGKVTRGLKPLTVIPQDATGSKEGVDAIQLVNGQIKVLKNAKKIPGTDQWEGLWDETRSTTVSNIATNRLNEQLSKAGSKELNSYLPLDNGAIEVQSTTSGGSQSTSGSRSGGGYKPSYSFGGDTYSLSEVEAAAKASNRTVDQYIKETGLK